MKKVLALSLAVAVLTAAGCGKSDSSSSSGSSSGGSSAPTQKTPEEAYKEFKAAGERGDAKAMWNAMSKKTRTQLVEQFKPMIEQINKKGDEEWEEAAKDLGRTAAELKKMSPEEFTEVVMAKNMASESEMEKAKKSSFDKCEMRGEIAVVFTNKHDGTKGIGALVKEDGTWKLDMDETKKLKDEERKLNEGK